MTVQASCPSCGAAVVFKVDSSMVTICEYCRSAVARGDRKLEDLGKVADLADTGSPLDVWLKGRYQEVPFELTGRAQIGHSAGGVWDEWYAALADGRWGWLAEAQGKFYLTFEEEVPEPESIPSYGELELGQALDLVPGWGPLMVAEKGKGKRLGARGEIPYLLVPGETFRYADLSGPDGTFATIDYSESPPTVYFGREVTLDDLDIPKSARAAEREARQVQALQVNCPNCGGGLELRAPDRTERVGCPNCGALLDVQQGNLKFLKALEPGKVVPVIPLGTVGKLPGGDMTAIGFMQRSVIIENVEYFWEEYLLYEPHKGFRWLVRSDDHWSYVKPLPPGKVVGKGHSVPYKGRTFKLFQKADAGVTYVMGEFYWRVEVGEMVRASDFVSPPFMLSKEVTQVGEDGEINWSLGTYMPTAVVEKAFQLQGLPRPRTVGPNQPFLHKRIYASWGILAVAALFVIMLVLALSANKRVFEDAYSLPVFTATETSREYFTAPFELRGWQNIRVSAQTSLSNTWLGVDGDLINDETGVIQPFFIPVEYYAGVEGGESWSEGSQYGSVYLSAVPAGNYILRLSFQGEPGKPMGNVYVKVEQGVPHLWPWFLTFFGIALVPIGVGIYHFMFEVARWRDSDYSPYGSSS